MTISDQTQPPEQEERSDLDWFELCYHHSACERVWLEHVDARELAGWMDEMARLLRCHDCVEWAE